MNIRTASHLIPRFDAQIAAYEAQDRDNPPGQEGIVCHKANGLVTDLCEGDGRLTFIDVNPCLFDDDGEMRKGFFKDDRVHLHPPAYRAFAERVRPVLVETWARV